MNYDDMTDEATNPTFGMSAALDNKNERPQEGGWAQGNYYAHCITCGILYIGDKRSCSCSDCAYGTVQKGK